MLGFYVEFVQWFFYVLVFISGRNLGFIFPPEKNSVKRKLLYYVVVILDFKFCSAQKNVYYVTLRNLGGKMFSSLTLLLYRALYFSSTCHQHIYTYIKFSRETIFFLKKLILGRGRHTHTALPPSPPPTPSPPICCLLHVGMCPEQESILPPWCTG